MQKLLKAYNKNKRELALIDKTLARLRQQLDKVPVISGKVMKSGDDFPYIKGHIPVKMAEPKESERLRKRIRELESRKAAVLSDVKKVEVFIEQMPEGIDKQVFEMIYINGETQSAVGAEIGYSQSQIAKIISKKLKEE